MTAMTQTNNAVHLSRDRDVSGFRQSSLRPGDGKRSATPIALASPSPLPIVPGPLLPKCGEEPEAFPLIGSGSRA
jgi:hypothetical protein